MKKALKVKGMHCHGCEMLITFSLKELSGVKDVKVSHQKGELEVTYDESQIDLNKILDVIKGNGYEPEEVK